MGCNSQRRDRQFFKGDRVRIQKRLDDYQRVYPSAKLRDVFHVMRIEARPPGYVLWLERPDHPGIVLAKPSHCRLLTGRTVR